MTGFGQGAFTLLSMAIVAGGGLGVLGRAPVLWAAGLITAFLLGVYPLTQIYQHEEDARRGDLTISRLVGIRGTFVLAAACLGLASLGVVAAGIRPGLAWAGAGVFVMIFAIQLGSASAQVVFQTRIEAGAQGRTKAARAMLSTSLMPLAFLSAGPLVDRLAGPALLPGGSLSASWVGRILGLGEGRGAGLLFVVSGTVLLIVTLAVLASPGIRRLEAPLPPCPGSPDGV